MISNSNWMGRHNKALILGHLQRIECPLNLMRNLMMKTLTNKNSRCLNRPQLMKLPPSSKWSHKLQLLRNRLLHSVWTTWANSLILSCSKWSSNTMLSWRKLRKIWWVCNFLWDYISYRFEWQVKEIRWVCLKDGEGKHSDEGRSQVLPRKYRWTQM